MIPAIVRAGDSAVVLEFDERIDPAVNARAIAAAEALSRNRPQGVRDIVPTYRSVAVYFDPLRTDYDALERQLRLVVSDPAPAPVDTPRVVRVPVCYGGSHGPDLEAVARFSGLSEDEVIARHTAATYRVFMLGFVPGFAYMGVVDPSIAMPRHATPRVRVPRGAVGIAGVQTGVYPAETPGGWQLVGHTPLRPFDAAREAPCLFRAGDSVQFFAVTAAEHDAWEAPR